MNEVNILNIGGIDYNIDDQLARDVIAHSENGLDPQSNLPISSRHYDEGDYLIGQDRLYYEAITDIEVGDVIAEGVNVRATIISDELVRLKNQSSIAVIQSIAKMESAALSSRNYTVGQYFYWDFGLAAGLYETIATITSGDAFSVGVNIKLANKIIDMVDGLSDAYNITGAKNLCPNNASDTVTTDITWDVLSDGSIQVSGTPADTRILTISRGVTLYPGTYKISIGLNEEIGAKVLLYVRDDSAGTDLARTDGEMGLSNTFTIASTKTNISFNLAVLVGETLNIRVFPMCRVASITDETYVPFAMTNRQLYEASVGDVLYSGSLGSGSSATLSRSAADYDNILIYYGYLNSLNVKITYNNASVDLTFMGTDTSSYPTDYGLVFSRTQCVINGKTITLRQPFRMYHYKSFGNNYAFACDEQGEIVVCKVVGVRKKF